MLSDRFVSTGLLLILCAIVAVCTYIIVAEHLAKRRKRNAPERMGYWTREDLPPFEIRPWESVQKNRARLAHHLKHHAPLMDHETFHAFLDDLEENAYPLAVEMQWQRDLEGLSPEDFEQRKH